MSQVSPEIGASHPRAVRREVSCDDQGATGGLSLRADESNDTGGVMVPIAIAGTGLGIIGLLVVILLVVLIVRAL